MTFTLWALYLLAAAAEVIGILTAVQAITVDEDPDEGTFTLSTATRRQLRRPVAFVLTGILLGLIANLLSIYA